MAKSQETIKPEQMVADILRIMKYGSHSPIHQNIYTKIHSYTTMFVMFVTLILQIIYVFTTKFEEFGIIIMDLVVIAAVWQIFAKCFVMHLKKKYILQLIDIIYNKFWTEDMLTEEEQRKTQEIYRYTVIITKGYTISVYLTMFGHTITAALRGNHNLIMNVWLPGLIKEVLFSSPYFAFILLTQFYLMPICTICGLIQTDNLFVTSVAFIIAQLRMLKNKLLSLGNGENNIVDDSKLIIKCIDHHNLIFEAIATIETIFSGLLLHIMATNIMLGVVTMLGLLLENNITQIVEFNFILVSVLGQLYIYCLLGQFIQDETLSVADAAYNCKWEDIQDRNIKISLLLTIQRSQKSARLTMGGILNLCLENFTRISRFMLSILTLMMNAKDDK